MKTEEEIEFEKNHFMFFLPIIVNAAVTLRATGNFTTSEAVSEANRILKASSQVVQLNWEDGCAAQSAEK